MVLSRRTRKNKNAASGERPKYIRTTPHDGSKYVDLDEFIKDKKIREQFRQLANQARHQ